VLSSTAVATDGVQQVGSCLVGDFATSTSTHAYMWSGTAASAVDLNPTNLGFTDTYSSALAISDSQQVGYVGGYATGGHAVLWSGSAGGAIDLNPTNLPGFTNSSADGIGGGQEVGYGWAQGGEYDSALVWNGTAASAVDLNPTGYYDSEALGTNGIQQVGYGQNASYVDALVWTGTAASVVNLQLFLPQSAEWSYSDAYTIDSSGNIYGLAQGPYNGIDGDYAVEWSQVPEPSSCGILAITSLGALLRRSRCGNPNRMFTRRKHTR
jgi:hypothetical protein